MTRAYRVASISKLIVFGKLYRRSFLERYNIRFTTLLSNEDTSFNCVVKGCTDKIWYIPKDVYIWHFKANSITRIKHGMYGQDSGYKGWSDAMVSQILELQKRFVNRNYILSEIIGNMVTHYVFHEENRFNYPMNTEISLNWCRGYYHNVYEPNEQYISEERFRQVAAPCLAGHNMAAKGIIPSMSLGEFMKEMKKPVEHLPNEETCGATPAGFIPPIVSPDWPVEITDYFDGIEPPVVIDSDTNHSRYGGMKKAIGIELNDDDYDPDYDGSKEAEAKRQKELNKEHYNLGTIYTGSNYPEANLNVKYEDLPFTMSCEDNAPIMVNYDQLEILNNAANEPHKTDCSSCEKDCLGCNGADKDIAKSVKPFNMSFNP